MFGRKVKIKALPYYLYRRNMYSLSFQSLSMKQKKARIGKAADNIMFYFRQLNLQ